MYIQRRSKTAAYFRNSVNVILIIPFIMLLSTVFVVNKELANGVVAGKYFWFYLSIGLIAVTTVMSFIINRKNIRFNILDLLVIAFCIASLSVSYYHSQTVNNKSVLLALLMFLYFYCRLFLVQYRWNAYLLTVVFILTGFIEAIWGLRQLYGFAASQHNLFKTTGSFFNPGPYAGYLALVLPCAFYYLLNDYRSFNAKFRKKALPFYVRWVLSALTVCTILLVLPATWSRAAWIASLGACLFVALCFLLRKGKLRNKLSAYYNNHKTGVLFCLFLSILVLSTALAGMYALKKDSADGRLLIWKTSVQVIKEHPFGVGLGNFAGSYGEKQAAYFASGKASGGEELVAGNPEYAFNEYLQIAVESGIVSLALFLSIAGYTIYAGMRKRRYALPGAFIALLLFALMSYPFNVLPFAVSFVFLVALCTAEDKHSSGKCSGKRLAVIGLTTVFLMLLTGAALYSRYPMYNAYKKWNNAKIFYNANLYKDVVVEYEKLYPYLNHEIQFLFEYAQALSKSGEYEAGNRILQKAVRISCDPMLHNIMGKNYQALKNYAMAEQSFRTAANIVPNRLYPCYLLGKLYHEMNMPEKVCEMTTYVHTKEAKVHSTAVDEMREEMQQLCNER